MAPWTPRFGREVGGRALPGRVLGPEGLELGIICPGCRPDIWLPVGDAFRLRRTFWPQAAGPFSYEWLPALFCRVADRPCGMRLDVRAKPGHQHSDARG